MKIIQPLQNYKQKVCYKTLFARQSESTNPKKDIEKVTQKKHTTYSKQNHIKEIIHTSDHQGLEWFAIILFEDITPERIQRTVTSCKDNTHHPHLNTNANQCQSS